MFQKQAIKVLDGWKNIMCYVLINQRLDSNWCLAVLYCSVFRPRLD